MTNPSEPAKGPSPDVPVRRVGTFTFGLVLVVSGVIMLVSMFVPSLDVTLAFRLSPVMLVSLGLETLLAARRGGRVRYDWVGMILCCAIVCTALVLYAMTWYLLHRPDAWFT